MSKSEFITIPAIDIMDGNCVRLRRGEFTNPSVYAASPLETAKRFNGFGFTHLHVVDLDAAGSGGSDNWNGIRDICRQSGCRVDVGGGIRTCEQVRRWLNAGADRVCVTTLAAREPETLRQCIDRFGAERFIVAADANRGRLALSGWQEESAQDLLDFILTMCELGIRRFMSTAVARDGMLTGPDFDLYHYILEEFPDIDLLASGGISCMAQVRRLRRMGLAGVVVGRALYEDAIIPEDLVSLECGEEENGGV
ncbi:MAG TPA: 1-(5-phosphoribosyl)-5-[(5-phosphoribosylamino)methylideneamino]imidazole-4-carboxamide isomerase [Candidatus Aminicenantes bacterium]|nr:1-(5-phosphoribosyl)-5-[(5-phosphoribosylamino)methylideneamino]imidazole-4-carboxamide isomerase [Candidatus Aminicenantes bacterium]